MLIYSEKWKEAIKSKFESDQEMQEKLHERKQGIEGGKVRLGGAKRKGCYKNGGARSTRTKWINYADQVVALYNNTTHTALQGHSSNSAHFNLMHDQTQPIIHQTLAESGSEHLLWSKRENFSQGL